MLHGLLVHNGLESVQTFEEKALPSEETLDVIPAVGWNSSKSPDDWWGPGWSGRSGSGTQLEKKIEDIRRTFGESNRRLIMSYPTAAPAENEQHDYQKGATGGFDDEWHAMAQDLLDMNMGDTIFRLSGEFNLRWGNYPTEDGTEDGAADPESYRDAYARCVDVMTDVSADFEFVYAPGGHRALTDDPEDLTEECWPTQSSFWPSGQSPPHLTPSFYDTHGLYPQDATEIQNLKDAGDFEQLADDVWQNGHIPELQKYADFADKKGARMGIVEWGGGTLGTEDGQDRYQNAPGDNPYYFRHMFEFFKKHDFVFQTYWNAASSQPGSHKIWPRGTAGMSRAWDAWIDEVRTDTEGSTSTPSHQIEISIADFDGRPSTYRLTVDGNITDTGTLNLDASDRINDSTVIAKIGDGVDRFTYEGCISRFTYAGPTPTVVIDGTTRKPDQVATCPSSIPTVGFYDQPPEGSTDWHIPLNDNFAFIESDLLALADYLGVNLSLNLARPKEGTTDWDVPLDENFANIEQAIKKLSEQNGASVELGYAQPSEGTTDWHLPLNDNFDRIDSDLNTIADTG